MFSPEWSEFIPSVRSSLFGPVLKICPTIENRKFQIELFRLAFFFSDLFVAETKDASTVLILI